VLDGVDGAPVIELVERGIELELGSMPADLADRVGGDAASLEQIGRASCRERV